MNDKHAHLIANEAHSDGPASLVGLCRLILVALLVAILYMGVSVTKQTQAHHDAYRKLQQLKGELTDLKVQEQRLLIEQQTFSATPQVARRAVSELGMFFPAGESRRIITPAATATAQTNQAGE